MDAKAGDLSPAHGGDEGTVAEFLARVGVGEVNFDGGDARGGDGVPKCDAGVGISGGVEDDDVNFAPSLLNPGDNFPFGVGLSEVHLGPERGGTLAHLGFNVGESGVPVDIGFALAEEVEVRPIEDEDFHTR